MGASCKFMKLEDETVLHLVSDYVSTVPLKLKFADHRRLDVIFWTWTMYFASSKGLLYL